MNLFKKDPNRKSWKERKTIDSEVTRHNYVLKVKGACLALKNFRLFNENSLEVGNGLRSIYAMMKHHEM